LHWFCDITWIKGQERAVVREGRVPAMHGIVGRVSMWERGIGKEGARKWKGKNVCRVTRGQWNVVLKRLA